LGNLCEGKFQGEEEGIMIREDSEIQDLMVECLKSTKKFAQTFFEERFHVPFSPLHDQIFDLIDSGEPRIAIAAPRGFGKTSIVGLALAAKKILFEQSKVLLFVGMGFDSACQQTENLKMELISNKLVRNAFQPIKARSAAGIDESFSKKAWVVSDRTLVYPRGSGQQIRGILYKNSRPDMLIIDDLEDPDTIENDDIRFKRKIWFHADLMKATSRVDKNWQVVYIDTLKHEDSLLEELIESPKWASLRLEACDDELNPTAPEFMPAIDVREEYDYHKKHGILDVFYREFRNIPISTEDAVFKSNYFKYYSEHGDRLKVHERTGQKEELIQANRLVNVVIVDPAKTVKLQSADSAVGVIGVDRQSRKIFVRDIFSGKVMPDELYNVMFEKVKEYNARVMAVEVTSLESFISQPIENEMRVRGVFPLYFPMKAIGKKEARVATLAPLYKLGYVYHNQDACTKLESQLLGFPRSKYWDVMDMFAYITKVMDEMAYYFDPDDMNDEDIESEFTDLELEDEKALEVVWA